jgi:transposase-like protein
MKCPLCKSSKHVEIDLHSEGFSEGVYECGDCSGVWAVTNDSVKINEQPRRKQRGINSLQPLRNRAASCGELDPL